MALTELLIRALGPQGDGVHQGRQGRIYVERVAPGDRIRARVLRGEDGVIRAEMVQLLEPSPFRQSAPCGHYDHCGNCTVQHVSPDFYRKWKIDLVKDAFRKQGLSPRQWQPPVFVGSHNRRRATFTATKLRGKLLLGYYRRRSKHITDIDSCLVAEPRLLSLRDAVKPFLAPLINEGTPVDVFLQIVGEGADVVLTGAIGRRGEPDTAVRGALSQLMKAAPITRLGWRAHEREAMALTLSKGPLVASFGPLRVELPPAAFLQPTSEGEQALVAAVLEALPAQGRFADLFSGCGTFSGPMLKNGSVDAFEMVPSAVKALSKAAGGHRLKVFRRDLFRNPLRREELNRYDAVVFDPPRAGCPEQVSTMASARVRTLIGVSCNPATFARDARTLCDGGYRLQSVQMVDQFLWSHHVELVGVFTKR